jgi:5-oxoprolinase (ATP-hydrolysing)
VPSSSLRAALSASPASFAIDVGGTFTDCLATAADGSTRRLKLLSSGVFKGTATRLDRTTLSDPLRKAEPPGFWNGARLVLLDSNGTPRDERRVVTSDGETGQLRLDQPLDDRIEGPLPYELTRDEPAPLLAIRWALGLAGDEAIPTVDVRLGTTRGTNALLTRCGARTAWVTTRGFGDALAIGDQERPELFDLAIRKPQPLAEATAEIDERLAADGSILVPLDQGQAERELTRLQQDGIESLAICLLHAYRNPVHEQQLERLAIGLGFRSVRVSHRVAPLIKLVARGRTTTVDAYLEPVLRDYLNAIEAKLGAGSRLSLMTSAGDLVAADRFSGKDSLLSGPAGGVVGLARVARRSGGGRGIGFDMGGTSTDVSRFDGRFEIESESRKAEVPLVVPTLAIETVAAGGGSICRRDAGRFLVGPESAGADPGPACYGRGGPLTVTDLNVRLGRVREERFPFRLDRAAVARRLSEAIGGASGLVGDRAASNDGAAIEGSAVNATAPNDSALDAAALGWWRIANAKMAEAIRSVSVAKGYDPRRYRLVAFGGAAAQHACAVAEALGMDRVLAPDDASILSAVGIGAAKRRARRLLGVYETADSARLERFEARFAQLEAEARELLASESAGAGASDAGGEPLIERAVEMRYVGTDAALRVERPAERRLARGVSRGASAAIRL